MLCCLTKTFHHVCVCVCVCVCVEKPRWVAVFSSCFIRGAFYVSFVLMLIVLDLDRDASVEDLRTLQCITAWLFTY